MSEQLNLFVKPAPLMASLSPASLSGLDGVACINGDQDTRFRWHFKSARPWPNGTDTQYGCSFDCPTLAYADFIKYGGRIQEVSV